MNNFSADVLVIGGGISGYRAAVAAAENGSSVSLIEKGPMSSGLVMGFNTFLQSTDNASLFLEDLLKSGCNIGSTALKHVLVDESRVQYDYLLNAGFPFDKDEKGNAHQVNVLGSSVPRLVHSGKNTGLRILDYLKEKCTEYGVQIIHGFAAELYKDSGRVTGAAGFDADGVQFNINAKATVMATGSFSALHIGSTYPSGLIGDGLALALKAGAKLVDMEFMQFEPCTFYYPEKLRGKLAVTTMLLKGGKLTNNQGVEFSDYKCNKNVLANLIMTEVKEGRGSEHGGVFYDVTKVDREIVTEENALFYNIALKEGIDFTKDIAEVGPAPHTGLGGIMIDENAKSTVDGLFACGEVAGGVHGANRIGGCAGSEIVAYGAVAGKAAAKYAKTVENVENKYVELSKDDYVLDKDIFEKISTALTKALPFYKTEEVMNEGLKALDAIETANLNSAAKAVVLTAKSQLKASMMRKESRGVFLRDDYKNTDSKYDGTSHVIALTDNDIEVSTVVLK